MHINPNDVIITRWPEDARTGMIVGMGPQGVRLTHIPTQTVIAVTTERSQHRNRDKAMLLLELALEEG